MFSTRLPTTHRHQHALRLSTSSAASAERQKHHQYSEAEENEQGILIVLLFLNKRNHESWINEHPNGESYEHDSGELQVEIDLNGLLSSMSDGYKIRTICNLTFSILYSTNSVEKRKRSKKN
jgi:hypothetical protein